MSEYLEIIRLAFIPALIADLFVMIDALKSKKGTVLPVIYSLLRYLASGLTLSYTFFSGVSRYLLLAPVVQLIGVTLLLICRLNLSVSDNMRFIISVGFMIASLLSAIPMMNCDDFLLPFMLIEAPIFSAVMLVSYSLEKNREYLSYAEKHERQARTDSKKR